MLGGLKCTECGVASMWPRPCVNGRLQFNHKLDCSQRDSAYPKMYTHQAENPSHRTEDA